MTYTENYALNQWAKTDRIQMSDFNADNAKIDAALTTLGTTVENLGTELLQTVTFSTSAVTQTVSLPAIDWSKYHYVRMDLQLTGSASIVYVQPNGSGSGCAYTPFVSSSVSQPKIALMSCGEPCSIFFISARDADRKIACTTLAALGGIGRSTSMTFAELTYLTLTSTVTEWPITGGTVKIWGIK